MHRVPTPVTRALRRCPAPCVTARGSDVIDRPPADVIRRMGLKQIARAAMEENGVPMPDLDAWTNSLVVRAIYGAVPHLDGQYVGGDIDAEQPYSGPPAETVKARCFTPTWPRPWPSLRASSPAACPRVRLATRFARSGAGRTGRAAE